MNALVPTSPKSLEQFSPIAPFLQAKRSPKTKRAYRSDLELFIRDMGLQTPQKLLQTTPEQVATYRDLLIEEGCTPATIARKLSVLRSFFSYCFKRGWVGGINPADAQLVEVPFVSQESSTNGLDLKEARALLDAPNKKTLKGQRDRALISLMLFHGLRREELVKLNTSSFGSERGHIVLTIKGKRGKVRKHPVQPRVVELIEGYLDADGRGLDVDGPLFRSSRKNRNGIPMHYATVSQIVDKYCKQIGINKIISPHSLRHTAITNALDNGATVRRVAHFSGHSDVKTTLRYDRNREDLDDNASLRIHYI